MAVTCRCMLFAGRGHSQTHVPAGPLHLGGRRQASTQVRDAGYTSSTHLSIYLSSVKAISMGHFYTAHNLHLPMHGLTHSSFKISPETFKLDFHVVFRVSRCHSLCVPAQTLTTCPPPPCFWLDLLKAGFYSMVVKKSVKAVIMALLQVNMPGSHPGSLSHPLSLHHKVRFLMGYDEKYK